MKSDPSNQSLLKKLVSAFFLLNQDIPADLLERIPTPAVLSSDQIAAFGQAAIASSTLQTKKKQADVEEVQPTVKKQKKKKKKVRYPKGFDPLNPGALPDPERWLPRHERTKGRRRNQNMSKGPQGAVPVSGAAATGRSRAYRINEDKNYLDNQRQKAQAAAASAASAPVPNAPKTSKKKGGKKRR